MHGEYKVSGGKLVVVDLDIEDGRLHKVQLSGDFFLEPDTALAQINAALEGLPATASADDIAQAVDAALDADVAMYGFSPEAVAATVLRALGRGPKA
ncbi:MAG: lipoate protein ligase C-terminal domain-containing protein [Rhodanobacteraceae bacterium]